MTQSEFREKITISGAELEAKVRELVHESNVRHLIIRHEEHTVLEIPVYIGIAAAVLAPVLAAVAAVGAILTHCTLEIVRTAP